MPSKPGRIGLTVSNINNGRQVWSPRGNFITCKSWAKCPVRGYQRIYSDIKCRLQWSNQCRSEFASVQVDDFFFIMYNFCQLAAVADNAQHWLDCTSDVKTHLPTNPPTKQKEMELYYHYTTTATMELQMCSAWFSSHMVEQQRSDEPIQSSAHESLWLSKMWLPTNTPWCSQYPLLLFACKVMLGTN